MPFVPCNIGEINQVVLNGWKWSFTRDRFYEKQGLAYNKYKIRGDANCVVISITDNGGGIQINV